jgi:hypothetical protein
MSQVSSCLDFGRDLRDLFKAAGVEAEFNEVPSIAFEIQEEQARQFAALSGMAFTASPSDFKAIGPLIQALVSSKIAPWTVPVIVDPKATAVALRLVTRIILPIKLSNP